MHRRSWIRTLVALTLATAPIFVPTPPATAAAAMSATSGYSGNTVSVGSTFQTSVTITNLNTPPETTLTLSDLFFIPSCGGTGPIGNDCPVADRDPGSITVAGPVVGAAGTACEGATFTVATSNGLSGRVEFTPSSPIVLGAAAADESDTCGIDFGVTVNTMPRDSRPGSGVQTDGFAAAVGTATGGLGAIASGGSTITISPAAPTLVTQVVVPEVELGEPVADAATLADGAEPTGTIAFDLYGPDDLDCSEPPVFTSVRVAEGHGTYESAPVAPEDPGQYHFIARYSGDADNLPTSGSCGDPNESVVVHAAEPPGLVVQKGATPLSRPEPGGTFAFDLDIGNTSGSTLTLTAVTDDIYGNVAVQGTCTDAVGTVLAPGDVYECTFPGELTGNAGVSQTDVVTASAVDQDGTIVTDEDDAVITLTDVPPTVTLDKSALPTSRVAPGGTFTFTVVVTNTSAEAATITSLTDDVYGDLTRMAGSTCATAVGTTLDPGGHLTCTFAADFTGAIGDSQIDVVTVTVTDDDGSTGTADDDAVVEIVDAASTTTTPPTTAEPTTTTAPPKPAAIPQLATTGARTSTTATVAVLLLGVGLVAITTGLRLRVTGRRD